ncbi:hypothetical protein L195_g050922, partial [Trifolium pratense]
ENTGLMPAFKAELCGAMRAEALWCISEFLMHHA